MNGRPGDIRGFVHKRLFGAVKGFIGGGPLGAVSGFVSGGQRAVPVTRPPAFPFQPSRPAAPACDPGFVMTSRGCVPIFSGRVPKKGFEGFKERLLPFGETGFEQFGEAVMGQYGAAIQPATFSQETLQCPRGTVLGTDNLCYNRRDIRNSERKWPRGRRPLLTGGEMRCISIASAAAKKLQRKQSQLRELGLLKAPPVRRAKKQITAGHHAHVAHD